MIININGQQVDTEWLKQQEQIRKRQLLDEKKCIMCSNANFINDQIAYCNLSGENVDNSDGKNCENWNPINV